MTCAITRLPDEPIVIIKIALPVECHIKSLRLLWFQVLQLSDELQQPVFCIIDLTAKEPGFSDILLWIDECIRLSHDSSSSAPVHSIVAGTHPMIAIGVKKMRQVLGVELSHVRSVSAALAAARAHLAQEPYT